MADQQPDNFDWFGALKASAEQADALREEDRQEHATRPPVDPEHGTVGDLSVGTVVFTTSHRFTTCRVCHGGIHSGTPAVAHWPVKTSTVADHYHVACADLRTL